MLFFKLKLTSTEYFFQINVVSVFIAISRGFTKVTSRFSEDGNFIEQLHKNT